MSRYGPERKAQTRQKILENAGRLFRGQGFAATGIQGLMAESELTVGGFYAHFESKEALFAEVFQRSLLQTRAMLLSGLEDTHGFSFVAEVARRYLSRVHRDHPAEGCALPTLAPELARQSDETKADFERLFRQIVDDFEPHLPDRPSTGLTRRDRALALAALLVGGLTLSRAVKSKELSDRILLACRRFAVAEDTQ